jgi:dATP pyrophosphohydrolase
VPTIVSDIIDVFVYRLRSDGPQFLLLRRSPGQTLAGTWQTVHGHIEQGETAIQTAVRELHEETRLTPLSWHQLESVNTFFLAARDEVHLCAGFAAQVGPEADPTLNAEHDDFTWLSIGESMERFHWPGERRAVREIDEMILPGGHRADTLRIDPV